MGRRGMNPSRVAQMKVEKGLPLSKLQKLRLKKGLTQGELAKAVGISTQSIRFYEQGVQPIELARLQPLIKICLVLNCKLEDIIENKSVVSELKQIK